MPLRSVIFRFQNANTKANVKAKENEQEKWFLCPKCGIYLLNAASKRDFSISEGKYKGKNANAKANAQENVFDALMYLYLECRFECDFRRQIQRQNANAKANAQENGFYALNAAFIS